MLGISLKPGEFAVIGDVIVRLTQIKHGTKAQVAIVAGHGENITRLDAWGNPVNCNRRIMAHRNHLDDPAVAQGHALLVLSCGHEQTIQMTTYNALMQSGNHVVDCADCRTQAHAHKARIRTLFNRLGPAGVDALAQSPKGCPAPSS